MSIVSSGITLNTAYNVTGDLTGNLIFQSNGTTEAVRIDTNQNVGIGTANPGQKLEVNGWVRTGTGASALGGLELPYYSGSASSRTWRLRTDGSSYGDFSIAQATTQGGATYDNKFYIDASGNVGLGTVSPTYKLNVTATNTSGDNGAILVTSPSTDGTQFRLNNTGTGGHSYTFYSTGSSNGPGAGALGIYDQTANSYRLVIDANGNFFVNSTTAGGSGQEKFSVSQSSGNRVAAFVNQTGTSGYSSIFSSIQSSGNNTSTYHFQGNTNAVGNWYLWGNGTTTFSSDQRLKKNIETARDGYLEDLVRLRVVKYNWKNDADGTPKELGLIAQDVEEVFAGLVQDDIGQISDEDTTIYKQLKVSVLPFMLLKSIQELKAIVDAQAIEIAELKGKA